MKDPLHLVWITFGSVVIGSGSMVHIHGMKDIGVVMKAGPGEKAIGNLIVEDIGGKEDIGNNINQGLRSVQSRV